MTRRALFAMVFGAAVAKALPPPSPVFTGRKVQWYRGKIYQCVPPDELELDALAERLGREAAIRMDREYVYAAAREGLQVPPLFHRHLGDEVHGAG